MSTKKSNRNKIPLRECISCGNHKPKGEMLRIVVPGKSDDNGNAGNVEKSVKPGNAGNYDETGKVRGRGAYICRTPECIKSAFEKDLITEAMRDELLEGLNKYILSMLSIAAKAGKISSGEVQCEAAISDKIAFFVIIAKDASPNTTKKFINKCDYYNVPYTVSFDKEVLGQMIGRADRSCVAVMDEGIAKQIRLAIN